MTLPIAAGADIEVGHLNPTDWTDVTFENGWSNFGSGWYDVQFRKHPDGTVELRGAMLGGTTTNGVVVFTLPVGFRPGSHAAVALPNLSNLPNSVYALRIRSTGACELHGSGATTTPVCTLDGVTFST